MKYGYSRLHRLLEWAGIVGFVALVLYGVLDAQRGIAALDGGAWIWPVAGLTGYVLGDFVSGLVHWAGDRYGSETTPLLGPNFVKPFREHHVDPEGICRHDFVEVNGNNCIVSLPVVGFAIFVLPQSSALVLLIKGTVLSLCVAGFLTNQFHKWSHEPEPPFPVRLLQRLHLILPPAHHDVHHTPPHDTYFCITTGWLNRPLAAIRFWAGLEWTLLKVFGAAVSAPEVIDPPQPLGAP
jgi:ubiquitin-conjugating enzyme E2 variant